MNKLSTILVGDVERRNAIKQMLRGRNDLTVCGEICDMKGLRSLLRTRTAADIVVLDCSAQDINIVLAMEWLLLLPKVPHIIALGATGTYVERRFLLELGAHAYATLESPSTLSYALSCISTAADPSGMVQAA